jgi:hypothetical protein
MLAGTIAAADPRLAGEADSTAEVVAAALELAGLDTDEAVVELLHDALANAALAASARSAIRR